jgi:hypothetical protein
LMFLIILVSFSWNTLLTKSRRSFDFYPSNSSAVISSNFGLHVKITNKFGLPNFRTIAIASWYSYTIRRGPFENVEGRRNFCPTCAASTSLASRVSWSPLYSSQCKSF